MFDYKTTLQQLGGINRLTAMIGAKNFTRSDADNYIEFSIGRGATNKANRIRITLTPMDLYKVTFYKIRGINVDIVGEVDGVYDDQLKPVIESETGMYLSL